MASELVYTSAEQGLKPQTHGFCTVAMTRGMARNIAERLEGLSGYRAHFAPHDPLARSNPVNYSYYRFTIGGRTCPVLSRVCFAEFDYTGRSNKLAHHFLLDEVGLPKAGPTRVALQPGLFLRSWSGMPSWLEPKAISDPVRPPTPAHTWQQIVGDSGWAGVVAEHTLAAPASPGRPKGPVAILYPPGFDCDQLLQMLDEVMALIPPERRWETTFSTYLTDMPTGTSCAWRCMLPDSPEWKKIHMNPEVLCIDLTGGSMPAAEGGALVAAARSGDDPYAAGLKRPPPQPASLRQEDRQPRLG